MKSTLPLDKDLYPFFLYCSGHLRLEMRGPVPRYEESFVDSSEEQIMTVQFVLHQICDYHISPRLNKFHYAQSPTNNDFSQSLFDILLDLQCSQTKAIWERVSKTTKDLPDAVELMRNLCLVSKKTDMDEVSIPLNFETKMDNLEDQFILTKPDQIRKFLLNNHYLLDILAEAPSFIWKVFGRVPIYLEIDRDPEEGWEEMFITIRSPFPAQKAMELRTN